MSSIEQGTEEWLKLRKGKITASKIAVIMGISPYQTPRQLWEEELGFREPQKSTSYMQKGLDIEDKAREYFKNETGIEVFPDVVIHPTHSKFMASLDGISEDRKTLVEIKNNNIEYHNMAKKGIIPEFHQWQMQWQMFVLRKQAPVCHYISYRENEDGTPDVAIVPLSLNYEQIVVAGLKAFDFLRMIDDLEEPSLIDSDYEDVSRSLPLQQAINEYAEYNRMIKHYTELSKSCKKRIVVESKERNVRGQNWKMTKFEQKGRVNYESLCENLNITHEKQNEFRGPSTTSYRITID